jgi:hypothetical protein
MLLIYNDEVANARMSPAEQEAQYTGYIKFTDEVRRRGAMLSGDALMPTTSATTVRVRDGKTLTTDGPFAETKEQLGGYYVVNCENLDEAIEIAALIPGAQDGSIEVRPIAEFD